MFIVEKWFCYMNTIPPQYITGNPINKKFPPNLMERFEFGGADCQNLFPDGSIIYFFTFQAERVSQSHRKFAVGICYRG